MNIPDLLKEKVAVFKSFSLDRLKELEAGSRLASFEVNEAVAHAGEEPVYFYVVLSGIVVASVIGDGGIRQVLGRLTAGETFGEMAIMTGNPMVADIIVEEPAQVLLIPVPLFQAIVMSEPSAVQHVSRTLMERMKAVALDPSKAAAALRRADDPYGLKLKGQRPEKILVINSGSSSLKYSFYDTANESRGARGLVERIGIPGTRLAHYGPKGEVKRDLPAGGFKEAITAMVGELTAQETGVLSSVGE